MVAVEATVDEGSIRQLIALELAKCRNLGGGFVLGCERFSTAIIPRRDT